jgi:hypothetical protein
MGTLHQGIKIEQPRSLIKLIRSAISLIHLAGLGYQLWRCGTSMSSPLAWQCVMTLCTGLVSLLNCTGKTKSFLHPSVQFFLTARGALNPTV